MTVRPRCWRSDASAWRKFKGRVKFIQSDLSKPGWSKKLKGPFDAVVSSIAIHNVREHATIRSIYGETFDLLNPGGCFLNLDRMRPSVNEQLELAARSRLPASSAVLGWRQARDRWRISAISAKIAGGCFRYQVAV